MRRRRSRKDEWAQQVIKKVFKLTNAEVIHKVFKVSKGKIDCATYGLRSTQEVIQKVFKVAPNQFTDCYSADHVLYVCGTVHGAGKLFNGRKSGGGVWNINLL